MSVRIGRRQGRLVVESLHFRRATGVSYQCRCDCGAVVLLTRSKLRRGDSSCGYGCPLKLGITVNRLRLQGLPWRQIAGVIGYEVDTVGMYRAMKQAYKYRQRHPDWRERVAASIQQLAARAAVAS